MQISIHLTATALERGEYLVTLSVIGRDDDAIPYPPRNLYQEYIPKTEISSEQAVEVYVSEQLPLISNLALKAVTSAINEGQLSLPEDFFGRQRLLRLGAWPALYRRPE